MKGLRLLLLSLAIGVGGAEVIAACSESGTCPAKSAIKPDAACTDDQLQCPYDLSTPSVACDGTQTVIPSSCTCSGGTWACPAPVDCSGGAGGDAGGTVEGGATGDGGAEAATGDATTP